MVFSETIFADEVKTLHQNVYNEAKAWFGNLPLVPRVGSDPIHENTCNLAVEVFLFLFKSDDVLYVL